MSLRIWVDADSCARSVRDVVARAAVKHGLPTFYVANRPIPVTVPSTVESERSMGRGSAPDGDPPSSEGSRPINVGGFTGLSEVSVAWKNGPVACLVVSEVSDSLTADVVIHQCSGVEDLVVTRDLPLAERLVQQGVAVMNDRGTLWTEDTIRERRSVRDAAQDLRDAGLAGEKGPRSFGDRELRRFAAAFDGFLRAHLPRNR